MPAGGKHCSMLQGHNDTKCNHAEYLHCNLELVFTWYFCQTVVFQEQTFQPSVLLQIFYHSKSLQKLDNAILAKGRSIKNQKTLWWRYKMVLKWGTMYKSFFLQCSLRNSTDIFPLSTFLSNFCGASTTLIWFVLTSMVRVEILS